MRTRTGHIPRSQASYRFFSMNSQCQKVIFVRKSKWFFDLFELRGTGTSPHLVFGNFDAHKWGCVFAFHLGLCQAAGFVDAPGDGDDSLRGALACGHFGEVCRGIECPLRVRCTFALQHLGKVCSYRGWDAVRSVIDPRV